MMERRRICQLWDHGNPAALVTLVRVEGSSYRRPGARLLIAADGQYAGSISGGCLEAEVIRKAQWLVREGKAVVERYSTLFDDTAEIPYGLGCGGTVDLLIEPAHMPECLALMDAMKASLRGEARRIVTWLPQRTTPLRREISNESEAIIFTSEPTDRIGPDLFAETLGAPQRLLVFGAGDDAQPMVRMAALLGWSVIVIDSRSQWAQPERFPEAERVIVCSTLDNIAITARDAVVLMTHSYEQDRAWLTAVLPKAPRYLGLLGARHRSALLVGEAAEMLQWPVARVCEGLFAPVGLDLGGDGAEAIALATIAEVQACCEGKIGVSRRMTPEAVAEQMILGGASRYLQPQCAL
ncbi:MAG TPA: XdhC family protein [Acidobacteriaceae bacterium]|nr:XdhC family protein [Acidobacteriaceae bacterium]